MTLKLLNFDLETTGGKFHEILHFGAYEETRGGLEQYVLPEREITDKATEIHGMYKKDEKLYNKRQNRLSACTPQIGCQRFFNYLHKVKGCGDDDYLVLCAHNCKRFDSKGKLDVLNKLNTRNISLVTVLYANLEDKGLILLPWFIKFSDSLDLMREYRRKIGKY